MLIGLLMLLAPGVVFLVTFPLSRRFRPGLRMAYRIVGGIVAFVGSGISYYFAAYTGDQGGIAAYFFQIGVILIYLMFSVLLIGVNWILAIRAERLRS